LTDVYISDKIYSVSIDRPRQTTKEIQTMTKQYVELTSDKAIFRAIEMRSDGRFDDKDVTPEMVICASNIIHGLNRIGCRYYTVILYQKLFDACKKEFGKYHIEITTSLW